MSLVSVILFLLPLACYSLFAFSSTSSHFSRKRRDAWFYDGLGEHAQEQINAYVTHYYTFLGLMAQQLASAVPHTPETIHATIQAFADGGVDELILWPCIAELDQVHRLAEIVVQ